ncbi:Synaptophysin [Manis pentadactyla]|nr:Synaptophysin [Manis pentadactyla]
MGMTSIMHMVSKLEHTVSLIGYVGVEKMPRCNFLVSRNFARKSTYWNQGYGYQQGYGPGYGGSDVSPHGYYGYGPGYYYRMLSEH